MCIRDSYTSDYRGRVQDKNVNIKLEPMFALTYYEKMSDVKMCIRDSDTPFPVLSEEGKHLGYETRREWDTLWIVDPLDGTKELDVYKRQG